MAISPKNPNKHNFFGFVISKLKTYLFTGILVTAPVTFNDFVNFVILLVYIAHNVFDCDG